MRFTTIIASAAVAAVLGGAGVSVAGAASNPGASSLTGSTEATAAASTTPAPATRAAKTTPKAGATHKGAKALRRNIRRGAGRIVAETIGITRPVLRQELRAGKTIATIATEHGVQPQAVITALENAAGARIDAAVTADRITAERAAKLKQRLHIAIPKLVNDWHPKRASHG